MPNGTHIKQSLSSRTHRSHLGAYIYQSQSSLRHRCQLGPTCCNPHSAWIHICIYIYQLGHKDVFLDPIMPTQLEPTSSTIIVIDDSHKPYGPHVPILVILDPHMPIGTTHVAIPLSLDPWMPAWTHICKLGHTNSQLGPTCNNPIVILDTHMPNGDPHQAIIVTEDSQNPYGLHVPILVTLDPHLPIRTYM